MAEVVATWIRRAHVCRTFARLSPSHVRPSRARRGAMGVVVLPQTRGGRTTHAGAARQATVARVQFKATKLMTKRRPKKVREKRTKRWKETRRS